MGGIPGGKKDGGGAEKAAMQYQQMPAFAGNNQGLISDQLDKGGYSGLLQPELYSPMNVGYVVDPQSGNRVYSGSAYMDAMKGGKSGGSDNPFMFGHGDGEGGYGNGGTNPLMGLLSMIWDRLPEDARAAMPDFTEYKGHGDR